MHFIYRDYSHFAGVKIKVQPFASADELDN